MKKLSALAIVAALAVSAPAYAVDATVKAGAAGSVAAGTTSVDAGADATATGSVSADSYGTLISTLNAGKGMSDLGAISADADITVVNVSSLKINGDTDALDNALDKNVDSMTTLHASINANTALKSKLEAQGVTIENVVAVTTAADGKVTVFVDDRA